MKLKIKNLEKFKVFANLYYAAHSNRCWNRSVVSCEERKNWYTFRIAHGGFEWVVKLCKNPDFVPGWPVEILWRKNATTPARRLMETNVGHDIVVSKEKWADWISTLIDTAVKHNHKLIHS